MANTVIVSTSDSQMVDEPLWMQATGGDAAIPYAAADDRALIDALFAAEGVIVTNPAGSGFKVAQRGAGANFSVDITAGKAAITGDDGANQRKYVVISNGTVNCVTPAAPGSGTRIHRIIARVRDKQVIGSGTYDWTLELLEDTGSGTPAQPNSAITLGLVSIASGQASVQTANITDSRVPADLYGKSCVVARANRTSSSTGTTSEIGVLRTSCQMFAGRVYRVSTSPLFLASTVANDIASAVIRFTTDGTTPSTSSAVLGAISLLQPSLTSQGGSLVAKYVPSANIIFGVVLTAARSGGTGTISIGTSTTYPNIDILIEDLGVDPGDTGVDL